MKYLLIFLITLTLVACGNGEINVSDPVEVVLTENEVTEENKESIEEIIDSVEIEPVVTKYPVKINCNTLDKSYTALDTLEKKLKECFEFQDEMILSENPLIIPEIEIDGYEIDLTYTIDGQKIYNKTKVYDNFEEYDAIKVEYEGQYYYAYYLESELLFAKVDERNRVTSRYGFKPSYSKPVYVENYISKNGQKAINNTEELKSLIESKNYIDGDKIYFNGDLVLNYTITKNKEVVEAKNVDNNTMRNLAEKEINNNLSGFKSFVEYRNDNLVDFSFSSFDGDLVIDPRPSIIFTDMLHLYGSTKYYASIDCYVENQRTNDVKTKIEKEVSDLEIGSTRTLAVDFKYEIYNDSNDDVVTGTYRKYVTVFRNE